MSTDFLVQDMGEPDATAGEAAQHPLEELPVDVLIYLHGSRYCETDRLSNTAWSFFGQIPKGWPLVTAICDYVHDRITFGYQHASSTKTAWDAHSEGRGVCRDFAHLAHHVMPLHEHPSPLLRRLSRRHRGATRLRSHGFQRVV
jgi:hypothetical protein